MTVIVGGNKKSFLHFGRSFPKNRLLVFGAPLKRKIQHCIIIL